MKQIAEAVCTVKVRNDIYLNSNVIKNAEIDTAPQEAADLFELD